MPEGTEGRGLRVMFMGHANGCARYFIMGRCLGDPIVDPFTSVHHYPRFALDCGHCGEEAVIETPVAGDVTLVLTCSGDAAKWCAVELDAVIHTCGERAHEEEVTVADLELVTTGRP